MALREDLENLKIEVLALKSLVEQVLSRSIQNSADVKALEAKGMVMGQAATTPPPGFAQTGLYEEEMRRFEAEIAEQPPRMSPFEMGIGLEKRPTPPEQEEGPIFGSAEEEEDRRGMPSAAFGDIQE